MDHLARQDEANYKKEKALEKRFKQAKRELSEASFMAEPILDSRAKSAFKIEDREGLISIYSQSLVNDEVLIDLVMYLAKK